MLSSVMLPYKKLFSVLSHLFLVIVLTAGLFFKTLFACQFPDYLQSNATNPRRNWVSHILERYSRFGLTVEFNYDQMISTPSDSKFPASTRTCLERIGFKNREAFIVGYKETQTDPFNSVELIKYSCIEFIQRSFYVFQMKYSLLREKLTHELCLNTTLDQWIVIDKANVNLNVLTPQSTKHCEALRGGYSVRVSRKGERSDCDASVRDEVRLEANCVYGTDEIIFKFRRKECIPEEFTVNYTLNRLHSDQKVRFTCAVHWSDSQFVFVLLLQSLVPSLWMLRLPAKLLYLDGAFTAYIFSDLIASSENQVRTPYYNFIILHSAVYTIHVIL